MLQISVIRPLFEDVKDASVSCRCFVDVMDDWEGELAFSQILAERLVLVILRQVNRKRKARSSEKRGGVGRRGKEADSHL